MVPVPDAQQECEAISEGHEVGEEAAENEEARGGEHKRSRPSPLLAVQTGGDEGPDLILDPGGAEEDSAQHGPLEPDHVEAFHGGDLFEGWRVAESLEGLHGRLGDEVPELVAESQADD